MSKNIFIIFFVLLTIIACTSVKTQNTALKTEQGIDGYVYKTSGNLMPMPGKAAAKPTGIASTIFIYEMTNIKDVVRIDNSPWYSSIHKKLITTTQSDSTGHFNLQLPVGDYSLFTKTGQLFYANLFDSENNIAAVKVEAGKLTKTVIKVDAGATY